jgi:hypothetical protein
LAGIEAIIYWNLYRDIKGKRKTTLWKEWVRYMGKQKNILREGRKK